MDPARLIPQLNNTGLQQKDNPLYQFLKSLISNLSVLTKSASDSSSSSPSTTIINNNTIIDYGEESSDESSVIIINQSTGGSSVDTYAAPLTNGDPNSPELVFDSFGDVIMVTGLKTP